jgi:hypothetical protein
MNEQEPIESNSAPLEEEKISSWLLDPPKGDTDGASETAQGGETPHSASIAAAAGLTMIVVRIHKFAAQMDNFPGWELTPDETAAWRELMVYVAEYLPIKNLGFIAAIASVLLIEMGKLIQRRAYKGANPISPKELAKAKEEAGI